MTNKAIGVMGKQDYEIGCEYVIEYNKTVDRNNSTRSDPNKVPEFNEKPTFDWEFEDGTKR